MKQDKLNFLQESAQSFNIALSQEQLDNFYKYWEFLNEYNFHTNIVSDAKIDTVFVKHFIDSLSFGLVTNYLNFDKPSKLIDIGTGGGFPSFALAIVFPNLEICAVDSVGKKTKFLEELLTKISLPNKIEILNTRSEELARNANYRELFDVCVSRAVGKLNALSEYCLPFVKKDGYFIAYKAFSVNDELLESQNALHILGGEFIKKIDYKLPEKDSITRNLIIVQKKSITPDKYPRRTGLPKKKPL